MLEKSLFQKSLFAIKCFSFAAVFAICEIHIKYNDSTLSTTPIICRQVNI